jgi:lipopolysaccharide biosynthesis protein
MADPALLRCLAFYLPQFHPIPENDDWWGSGFTEWTNVARATARFRGHDQPRFPADLGFYDLRLPETRAAQAHLAASHGIDGFCYYHYWMDGRRLLERPFDEVLRSGKPDFPFCLCWANENWTRVWDGGHAQVLARQTYSPEDDLRHMRWLVEAFCDGRHVRVDGRPLFLVYKARDLPEPARTAETWRSEAQRLGAGELYLCAVQQPGDHDDPTGFGFDAAVEFTPDFSYLGRRHNPVRRALRRYLRPNSPYRVSNVVDYWDAARRVLDIPPPAYKRYPCVTPRFDNSPRRRGGGALMLVRSSPERYARWLEEVVARFQPYSSEENLVFVNAWNEWAEGNYLEPCQEWGRAYLEAHARIFRR